MSEAQQQATRLLQHYMTTALTAAGVRVDGDVYAEIEDIVGLIFGHMDRKVQALEARIEELDRDIQMLYELANA